MLSATNEVQYQQPWQLAANYQELRIQNVAVLHRSQTISTQQASGRQDLLGDVFVFKLLPGLYTCTLKVSETKAGKAAHVIRRYMCNRKGRDMANLGTHSSLIDFPKNPEDTSLPWCISPLLNPEKIQPFGCVRALHSCSYTDSQTRQHSRKMGCVKEELHHHHTGFNTHGIESDSRILTGSVSRSSQKLVSGESQRHLL